MDEKDQAIDMLEGAESTARALKEELREIGNFDQAVFEALDRVYDAIVAKLEELQGEDDA
jgi:hypothetical protein